MSDQYKFGITDDKRDKPFPSFIEWMGYEGLISEDDLYEWSPRWKQEHPFYAIWVFNKRVFEIQVALFEPVVLLIMRYLRFMGWV